MARPRPAPRRQGTRHLATDPLVYWLGPFFNPTGYGDEARGFAKALIRRGVRLSAQALDTSIEFAKALAADDPDLYLELVASMKYEAQGPTTAVIHTGALAPIEPIASADRTIARTMWETDGLPAEVVARLNTIDEVWVPSAFNAETFRGAGVLRPIRVIGGGVDSRRFRPGLTPLRIPGRRTTTFLAIFEWSYRKGWDVLLRAWSQAFRPEDDVTLVLRTYPRNQFTSIEGLEQETARMFEQALAEIGLAREQLAPVVTIGRHMTPAEMPRLYAAAQCYVAPSRGEGWCRPLQEAMSTGLPVIGTRWSGGLSFMDGSNSLLLDIEGLSRVDGRMDVPHYRGQLWAEPSVDHLAELLARVASDERLRRELGQRARKDMVSRWSWDTVAEKVVTALER